MLTHVNLGDKRFSFTYPSFPTQVSMSHPFYTKAEFTVGDLYLYYSYNQILWLIIQHSLTSGCGIWVSLQTLPYRLLAFISDFGVDNCHFLFPGLLWSLTDKQFHNPHYHFLHKFHVPELLQKPVIPFSLYQSQSTKGEGFTTCDTACQRLSPPHLPPKMGYRIPPIQKYNLCYFTYTRTSISTCFH